MVQNIQHQEMVLYQTGEGGIELLKDATEETIYASLEQIAVLFGRDKSVISRHIRNIYNEKELDKEATIAKYATVQKEGKRYVKREIEYYNLDMILSVGYRVNSYVAVQFRRWATKLLKEYIIKGYSIHKNRLEEALEDIKMLIGESKNITTYDVIELIKAFTNTWITLDAYDKNSFIIEGTQKEVEMVIKEMYDDIEVFKNDYIKEPLFGKERDKNSLESIIGNVFQSINNEDVYKTIEEKAVHLLYFIVKNHPFIDGNKRIGAFIFIQFLNKTGVLSTKHITPEALSAITIMIAEADPRSKERMIGVLLLLLR